MGDPFGILDALYGLAGPFLIPVALFALGLAGYAVLLALGRVGVLGAPDDGSIDGRLGAVPDVEGTAADGTGNDGRDGDGSSTDETDGDGSSTDETVDVRPGADGSDTGGTDDRPRRV